jgi:hypothetical protein
MSSRAEGSEVEATETNSHLATDAIEFAQFYSRSHNALIRVYDDVGNVIETHKHAGDFKEV